MGAGGSGASDINSLLHEVGASRCVPLLYFMAVERETGVSSLASEGRRATLIFRRNQGGSTPLARQAETLLTIKQSSQLLARSLPYRFALRPIRRPGAGSCPGVGALSGTLCSPAARLALE